MAKSYSDIIQDVRKSITIVSLEELDQQMKSSTPPTLLDVREKDERRQGYIPNSQHIPRGFLEMQVESRLPDKTQALVIYCAAGTRSALAANLLQEMGYTNVSSVNPGFGQWKDKGYPVELPVKLSETQLERYSRHIMLPEIGEKGQKKLLESKVLLLGAGGLGSPAAMYLAAAGVGTLGIIDADVVDASNLQRQILHGMDRIGKPKVESGKARIQELNPDVKVLPFQERLTSENIDRIFDHQWDVVVDGLDNFPTRYLVNDASVWKDIPVVHGSIFRFDGQVTTFWPKHGPCYRCLYPEPPPPHLAPSCAEAGVLGVLPGIIGTLQATEAVKIILGKGDPLIGRLLTYDSLKMKFGELKLREDPNCVVCGPTPSITEYIDYEGFCAAPA